MNTEKMSNSQTLLFDRQTTEKLVSYLEKRIKVIQHKHYSNTASKMVLLGQLYEIKSLLFELGVVKENALIDEAVNKVFGEW